VLSSTALAAQGASEFNVNWASPASPTGVYAQFYQKVGATGSAPYEIRTSVTNPFTGEFRDDFPLVGGSVLLGDYVAGGSPTLTATVPNEGAGAYRAGGIARCDAGLAEGAGAGLTTQIAMPDLQPGAKVAGFVTITGTIVQAYRRLPAASAAAIWSSSEGERSSNL